MACSTAAASSRSPIAVRIASRFLSSADLRVFVSADLNEPIGRNQDGATDHMHSIDNSARVFNHFVRKKIEDIAYQLTDAHSKYRWHAPLSRIFGFTTVSATLLSSRSFCSRPSNSIKESQASPIDYSSVLQEDEFNKLADSTIHDLLEKLEEYGDNVEIDGFDIDYGSEVLTLKLGNHGTYVVNKQTPNRQIWLSSPVSGPARFDWDSKSEAWIYRRNQANLFKLLETEIEQLCGQPLNLS